MPSGGILPPRGADRRARLGIGVLTGARLRLAPSQVEAQLLGQTGRPFVAVAHEKRARVSEAP